MKILVSSSFENTDHTPAGPLVFRSNKQQDTLRKNDLSDKVIEFRIDGNGTQAYFNGARIDLSAPFSDIRNTRQMQLVLNAHQIELVSTGEVTFTARPGEPIMDQPHNGPAMQAMACAGVACATVGCAGATCAGAGCAAAGCATVGCAAAACGAVGCAGAACAAAGKNTGGCGSAACGAVACAAAGCAAAACAAVGCALAGCATVACGAADGECGAAACALDAFCAANAGWPP